MRAPIWSWLLKFAKGLSKQGLPPPLPHLSRILSIGSQCFPSCPNLVGWSDPSASASREEASLIWRHKNATRGLLYIYFWLIVQQRQRNALGSWGMSQGLSFTICIDRVGLDRSKPESLCSQETMRVEVKAKARLHLHSAQFVVWCGFGLRPSLFWPSLVSSQKTAKIFLPCCGGQGETMLQSTGMCSPSSQDTAILRPVGNTETWT